MAHEFLIKCTGPHVLQFLLQADTGIVEEHRMQCRWGHALWGGRGGLWATPQPLWNLGRARVEVGPSRVKLLCTPTVSLFLA